MNRVTGKMVLLAVVALVVAGTASTGLAHTRVIVGGNLGWGFGWYRPAPVYYAAPPIYYVPAPPIYYVPAPPIYYVPAPPVYYAPRPVYCAPPPVTVVRAPVVVYKRAVPRVSLSFWWGW